MCVCVCVCVCVCKYEKNMKKKHVECLLFDYHIIYICILHILYYIHITYILHITYHISYLKFYQQLKY